MSWIKLFHMKNFQSSFVNIISMFTEITLDYGGKLKIGNHFKMRDGAKIRVRRGANCIIGNNTSVSSNNIITCHEKIVIGDNVQLSPNVQIYDHDHDFRVEDGIKSMKYRTSPVTIGDNVWIGANSVILRGASIGNNSIIAANSVVKGKVPADSVYIQKREATIKEIRI